MVTTLRHTDVQPGTKTNFSNSLEVDRSGWREQGGAEWPSGEIISANQSTEGALEEPEMHAGNWFPASILGY